MKQLHLTLPYPPGVNAMWRTWRGRVLLSKRGREYRAAGMKQLEDHAGVTFTEGERVRVQIEMWPPDLRRRDIDSVPKGVLDLLTHAGIWSDDFQVDELTVVRKPKVRVGRLVLTITELPQEKTA